MKLRVIAVGDLECEDPETAAQLKDRMEDSCTPIALQEGAIWWHWATRIRRAPDETTTLRKMRVFGVIDLPEEADFRTGLHLQDRVEKALTPYFDSFGVSWRFFDTQVRRDKGPEEGKAERLKIRTTDRGVRIS